MIFDLLVAWPKNCDYPLFRKMIEHDRKRFAKVIVAFTEAPGMHDYETFVRRELEKYDVLCITTHTPSGEDWRNVAMNQALRLSDAPYVWFTEQDFMPSKYFWDFVDKLGNVEAAAVFQGDRMHPCSMFVQRDILDKTSLDFSAKPPEHDHFGQIQKDLYTTDIAIWKIPDDLFFHYNGLSHNWRLVSEGEPAVYEPGMFADYLRRCLRAGVILDDHFVKTANGALQRHKGIPA